MAYCPICKGGFPAGIMVCPDCNAALVDQVPNKGVAAVVPDDSWVIVAGVISKLESRMATGSLNLNNIPSVLVPSGFLHDGLNLDPADVVGELLSERGLIMVPREFLRDAELILRSVLPDDFSELEIR